MHPTSVGAAACLGAWYNLRGRHPEAIVCFTRARDLAAAAGAVGPCRAASRGLAACRAAAVHRWHFRMVQDPVRNAAYATAIRAAAAAVGPGAVALDVGTGAGLLSMMLADAGCRVWTWCVRGCVFA